MSKVDLSVFEEFKEVLGFDEDLDSFVYQLCEGNIHYQNEDLKYPERCGRAWSDETWQKEYREYCVAQSKFEDEFFSKYGYKPIEQEGGGEGGAEYCHGIFSLGGKIYKAEYSYYSYDGHDYEGILSTLREVKPVEKTVIFYE